MKSFWKRQRCLFAVVLAAGGAGTFLGLQPALADKGRPMTSSIAALGFFSGPGGSAQIFENPDGTAVLNVGTFLSPTVFLGVLSFDSTDFTISTDIQPGQAGRGTGSGTGHFTMDAVFAFDFSNGMLVGPFDVSVDIAVADATEVSASVSQGVRVQTDPFTGEVSVFRQNVIGSQAIGFAAASLSIFVDDGTGAPGLVDDLTGIFGVVGANSVHTVERIR